MVPVPKKGDLRLASNYRGISLMCNIAKVYNKVLLYRLRRVLEPELRWSQNGFRPLRSTVQHITALRMLIQHCLSHPDLSFLAVFIDYTKAFDSVRWRFLVAALQAFRVPEELIKAIMSLYKSPIARVRTADGISDPFDLIQGVLQGDTLAPYLFIIVMEAIFRRCPSLQNLGFSLTHSGALSSRGTGPAAGTRQGVAQAMVPRVYCQDLGMLTIVACYRVELFQLNLKRAPRT